MKGITKINMDNFKEYFIIFSGVVALADTVFIVLFILGWGMQAAFFWAFTVALFWWRLDSRISIGFALVGLITIPILLTFEYEQWAEQVAVWVYFFLVIGVVKQIWEYKTGQ